MLLAFNQGPTGQRGFDSLRFHLWEISQPSKEIKMTLISSHPNNTNHSMEVEVHPGGGCITMTAIEFTALCEGQRIMKRSEDSKGPFVLTVQLVRKD